MSVSDYTGGYTIVYMVIGIGTLFYTSVLSAVYAHTKKMARLKAQRPESDADIAATMLAFAFPAVMTLTFPVLFFDGHRLLAIGATCFCACGVAWFQKEAWGSSTGAKTLVAGSLIIAGASYGALLYSDSQTGFDQSVLNLLLLTLAPLLWHVVHGVSLDRDRAVYEANHKPMHCRNCGYSLAGLIEPNCPECGRAF